MKRIGILAALAIFATPVCAEATSNVVAGRGLAGGGIQPRVTLHVGAGPGIKVAPNAVLLDTTFTDGLYVNEGQADSVTAPMIVNGAITAAKLAPGVLPPAAPKYINLNLYGTLIGTGATFNTGAGRNAGLTLNNATNNSFANAFTIPPDFTGTSLTVHVIWHSSSDGCGIRFSPFYLSVGRVGRLHLVGLTSTAGITVDGGSETLTSPDTLYETTETQLTITSPDDQTFLAPGDAVSFGVLRDYFHVADTCTGYMRIQALWVSYQ